MNIAFVSTEVYPFAKVGGLGDVSSSLPIALSRLKEEVVVFMPLYQSIDRKKFRIRRFPKWEKPVITVGGNDYEIGLFRGKLNKVTVYFIENEALFGRDGVYCDRNGTAFLDGHTRAMFFSRAVLEVINKGEMSFDLIHINDSHTALIAPYLKTLYQDYPRLSQMKIVLTIHNLGRAYQGIHEAVEIEAAGLSYEYFYPGGPFEFYNKFNFLKAGIHYADAITTVSERYAREIQGEELGEGLNGILNSVNGRLRGILNGIDNIVWHPKKDSFLVEKYDIRSLKKKNKNKQALLKQLKFDTRSFKKPLIGMITRLTEQKGVDILLDGFEELMDAGVQLVVLGTGEAKYEDRLKRLAASYSDQFSLVLKYDEELAHLIQGGADMLLMPSRYEPCGLNQLYALSYGTIPVVRATGGLDDSVVDLPDIGTGFKFDTYSSEALVGTIKRALSIYDTDEWEELMKRGMGKDFSWDSSARKYIELYRSLCDA